MTVPLDVLGFFHARISEQEAAARQSGDQAAAASATADRMLYAAAFDLGDPGWDDAILHAIKIRATTWQGHPDYRNTMRP